MANLLLNPGFESGFSNYGANDLQATDWFDFSLPGGSWAVPGNIAYNEDNANQHSGAACQKITIAAIPSGGTHLFGQCFSIAAGQSYQAGFWLKSATANLPVQCWVRQYDPVGQVMFASFTVLANTAWQYIDLNFMAPLTLSASGPVSPSAPSAFIGLSMLAPGTLYLDDAIVSQITALPAPPSTPIPAAFFGVHMFNVNFSAFWPGSILPFGTWRFWDNGMVWDIIETASGTYSWGGIDSYMQTAYNHGVKVIYTFGYTPSWSNASGITYPPGSNSDAANFIAALINRYKAGGAVPCPGTLEAIELWNEWDDVFQPNVNGWSGTTAQMYSLAAAVYAAAKAADPTVKIIAPNITTLGLGNQDAFLNLCRQNANFPFDWVSIHVYPTNNPEADAAYFVNYQNLLKNYGLSNVPMLNTEGAYTTGNSSTALAQNTLSTLVQDQGEVARSYLLNWIYGIQNFCWYAGPNFEPSTPYMLDLTNTIGGNPNQLTQAGTAYAVLASWLVSATIDSFEIDSAGNYIAGITLANGKTNLIVWNPSGGGLNLPEGAVLEDNLAGLSNSLAGFTVLTLNAAPIRLDLVGSGHFGFPPNAPGERVILKAPVNRAQSITHDMLLQPGRKPKPIPFLH